MPDSSKGNVLYRFWAADESLLYVGISIRPWERWRQHRQEKPWWHEVTTVTIENFANRAELMEAEVAAIVAEKPRYNVAHAVPTRLSREAEGMSKVDAHAERYGKREVSVYEVLEAVHYSHRAAGDWVASVSQGVICDPLGDRPHPIYYEARGRLEMAAIVPIYVWLRNLLMQSPSVSAAFPVLVEICPDCQYYEIPADFWLRYGKHPAFCVTCGKGTYAPKWWAFDNTDPVPESSTIERGPVE